MWEKYLMLPTIDQAQGKKKGQNVHCSYWSSPTLHPSLLVRHYCFFQLFTLFFLHLCFCGKNIGLNMNIFRMDSSCRPVSTSTRPTVPLISSVPGELLCGHFPFTKNLLMTGYLSLKGQEVCSLLLLGVCLGFTLVPVSIYHWQMAKIIQ